jgi:hypothetical protein
MILKQIYLMPDWTEFQSHENSDFQFETRHICNYIERRLAPEKVVMDGFNRIVVVGQSAPGPMFVNSSHVLSVPVPINMDQWRPLVETERPNYYANLLKAGFDRCATQYNIPVDNMTRWLAELEREGYRNEWVYKIKKFPQFGIRCALECSLTIHAFILTLRVSDRHGEIFCDTILTTKPDEIIFHNQFKDIVVDRGAIVVTKRTTDGVLFRMPIPSIQ